MAVVQQITDINTIIYDTPTLLSHADFEDPCMGDRRRRER